MFPTSLDLSQLNGSNGFIIKGIDRLDSLGSSVSNAGDLNGDGFDDIIVGAPNVGEPVPDGRYNSSRGAVYVLFGGTNVGSNNNIDLTSLNGTNGFSIAGVNDYERLGSSVSNAGDVNGDGIDDIIFSGDAELETYVVFGGSDVGNNGQVELASLDGTKGFIIESSFGVDFANLVASVSSAGDINGDGVDDLILGAPRNQVTNEGTTYVVFGEQNIGSNGTLELSSLDGTNGFALNGIDPQDYSGNPVSNLGDVNGDGFDDIIVGAPYAGPLKFRAFPPMIAYNNAQGEAYVVFGGNNFESSIELSELNGNNGFLIEGLDEFDLVGISVSNAGDVNGDGIADIIIGASGRDPADDPNNRDPAGVSYVLFGGNNLGSGGSLDLSELNGTNGFAINGIDLGDRSGASVSSAGDVNGDGIADILINAPRADPGGQNDAGETYLVFGSNNIGSSGSLALSDLNGNNGFLLNGIDSNDLSGASVSNAGDVNGDGISDILIGEPDADSNGERAGESYVVFGFEEPPFNIIQGTSGNDVLNGTANNDLIEALAGNDTVNGFASNDSLLGNDGVDLLFGNAGNDTLEGGNGVDTLRGGADNDLLRGNSGVDILSGNNGNDVLVGGSGNDNLRGDGGNDTLDGGNGNDSLFGAAGGDFFTLRAGQGIDSIFDYSDGVDKFILAGGLEFGQLEIVQNLNNTQIKLDDSNEVLANLSSVTANFLDAADFITT
jgi:Ca2+-binding RTX toxin-like protein